ncbi:hypothetical protein, partial [Bacillus thuringiensis]|uniref:hypothetical protein n=1 Tax=Bacillus thuringiensis TaxID=1428 RepID=UPI0019D572CA
IKTIPMSKTIIFFIILTPYRLIYGFYIEVIIILLCISDYHCCFVYELYYVGISKLFALLIHHSYNVLIYDFIKQKSACT